ncbi:hypothetical protein tloyanaT_26400 [Thalassotalea loyana]|uniref:Uncharacterized protein n=1 Tax=Thalassotalea loyana TaxID=280483 RepID=A0ABQ6HI10_9GAMM|nr:hypothetical protein [Thalassotalea loyana]GLX86387.1 hypothetical protein tloyanaT_26400 [Thalassotalea loyana]
MLNEIIYLGSDNEIELIISQKGGDKINFISAGTTRMELTLGDIIVNSDTSRLNYFNDGRVVLKLGDVPGLDVKQKLPVKLKVFDPAHPKGQTIIHPMMHKSKLTLLTTE